MKKFLSVVLTVAMLACVLCAVPAQAKPYEGYPFAFEDFENGIGALSGGSAAWANEGAGGSNGSALIKLTNASNQDISVACTEAPQQNSSLKFSAWVKLDNTEAASGKDTVNFIIYGQVRFQKTDATLAGEDAADTKTVTGWREVGTSNVGLKMGEWVYVTTTHTWDGTLTAFPGAGYGGVSNGTTTAKSSDILSFSRIALRVAGGGTSGAADTTVSSLNYYIDDITYEAIPNDMSAGDTIGKNIVTGGELDTTADMQKFGIGGSPSIVTATETDPAPDGSAGYLKLQPKDNAVYWPQLTQNMTWEPNHMYHVSYYMRLDTPKDEGKDTASVLSGTASINMTSAGGWLLQLCGGRIPDTNGYNTTYPGRVCSNVATFDNGWQKVDYYFVHEYKTVANQQFTTWLRLYPNSNKDAMCNASFSLDSFKIIDMGAVSNGDFEADAAGAYVLRNQSQATQDVLGWTGSDATLARADDVAADSTGSKSMQVSVTADGGYAYQGIELAQDAYYKISFRAKGVGLNGEVPIALVLDRMVSAEGNEWDVWNVPDYEYYTGPFEKNNTYTDDIKAAQEWKLTNDWQTYTCYVSNCFDLDEGKTLEDAKAYTVTSATDSTLVYRGTTIPRLPMMYWVVNDNAAGTTYLLDDVTIEAINAFPSVSNVQVNGKVIPGKEISVSYDYLSALNLADTYTTVRVYSVDANGQRVSLGTFRSNESFTVPETAIGKTLVFDVLPIDETKTCGYAVSATAADPGAWAKLYVEDDYATRAYASEDTTVTIIFAAYNDKELADVEAVKDVALTANTRADIAVPEGFDATNATSVKVMLWNNLTDVAPLCEAVEK